MSNTHNIPATDFAFNEKQQLVVTQVTAHASEWKINRDYLSATVTPAKTLWETKYTLWQQLENRTKPHGVAGAVVRYAILPAPPTDVNELTGTVLDTVSPCREAQRGSRVYYCLAWQNTRGEKGPWSQIEMAIVP